MDEYTIKEDNPSGNPFLDAAISIYSRISSQDRYHGRHIGQ